jgi:hypothetical protein
VPQIYSAPEFARLQRALEAWTERYRNTGTDRRAYPLTGRIICGCGFHWRGGLRKGIPYYSCSQHLSYANQKLPVCDWTDRRFLQAEKVEAVITELLYQHVIVDGSVWTAVNDFIASSELVDPEELTAARVEVDKLEDRLAVLYEKITDLDPAAFKKATTKTDADLADARDRLTTLEQSGPIDLDVSQLVRQVEDWFGSHDLVSLVTLLDVKVQLTGFDTFTISYGIPVGAEHIRSVIRSQDERKAQ